MQPLDPTPPSPAVPAGGATDVPPDPSPGSGPADRDPARPRLLWVLALAAGVSAGIVSWLCGEAAARYYAPPAVPIEDIPGERTARMQSASRTGGPLVSFGVLGGALGLALGLAGGATRRSARAAIAAAVVGLVAGAAAGNLTSSILVPIYYRHQQPQSNDLALSLLAHGGIWSTIGAAAGLAMGLGLGGRSRIAKAAQGGLLGALVGTVVYEIVGALAFPLDQTGRPLSTTATSRLFARMTIALFVAAGAALVVQDSRKTKAPTRAEPA